jgi:hypothetical protein
MLYKVVNSFTAIMLCYISSHITTKSQPSQHLYISLPLPYIIIILLYLHANQQRERDSSYLLPFFEYHHQRLRLPIIAQFAFKLFAFVKQVAKPLPV